MVRKYQTKNWPCAVGTVIAAYGPETSAYPAVQLVYKYEEEGESWVNSYSRGFYYSSSARNFVDHFRPGIVLSIRYKPGNAGDSVIRRADMVATR